MVRPSLEQQIRAILSGSGISVATAESCTGGLVSYRLTSVGGSSAYVLGGIVAYTNDLKHQLLGVSRETLQTRGAVSAGCAVEMAEGIRRVTGATIGISTTGIAGPGGATPRKPVGLIYVACASSAGTEVVEVNWRGDRARHMHDAADRALRMIIDTARKLTASP